MQTVFRPLPVWPHGSTPETKRRSPWTFKAGYSDTLRLLEEELIKLHAHNVTIGIGLRESDIRLDGMPRANAQQPLHPGVELSFEIPKGSGPARTVRQERRSCPDCGCGMQLVGRTLRCPWTTATRRRHDGDAVRTLQAWLEMLGDRRGDVAVIVSLRDSLARDMQALGPR